MAYFLFHEAGSFLKTIGLKLDHWISRESLSPVREKIVRWGLIVTYRLIKINNKTMGKVVFILFTKIFNSDKLVFYEFGVYEVF